MAKKVMRIIILILSPVFLGSMMLRAGNPLLVTNNFETEYVDIRLVGDESENNEERGQDKFSVVLPADRLSIIPQIFNNGCDCFVRVKATLLGNDAITEGDLFGIGEHWIKADDGYYYYDRILPHGESVSFFQGLLIPENLSQENQGKRFRLEVSADAVQSKNFCPKFQEAAPWGNVEVTASKKDANYEVNILRPSKKKAFQIRYEGESDRLVTNSSDFFQNFPKLLPGDCFSDTITMHNDGDKPVKVYFRSMSRDGCELSKKIHLKIYQSLDEERKTVYEGSMAGNSLGEDLLLGILSVDETADFEFEISVPDELNNQYSLYSSQVTWVFSAETRSFDNAGPVHTGDESKVMIYIVTAIISLIIYLWINFKRREERAQKYKYK